MHPDQRALLNGIIAEPERDDLRLIYSDWLEEREAMVDCNRCNGKGFLLTGTPPAPLRTRMTCPVCNGACRVSNGMAMRAEDIREQCASPKLWHPAWGKSGRLGYNRGFIAEVRCTMPQWLQDGPAICSEHPVERVVITDKEPAFIINGEVTPIESQGKYGWHLIPKPIDGAKYFAIEFEDHLPSEFHEPSVAPGYYAHQEDTAEAANEWLSARCIAWAREQAATMQSTSTQRD